MTTETGSWVPKIQQAIDNSHFFLAYDLSKEALEEQPENLIIHLMGTLALVQAGAIQQAKKSLESIIQRLEPYHPRNQSKAISWPKLLRGKADKQRAQERHQILDLLGDIYFRIWQQHPDDEYLRLSHGYYSELFKLNRSPESGINAALLSSFLNETDTAEYLANEVISRTSSAGEDNFKPLAIIAEAHLLLDKSQQAETLFGKAVNTAEVHYSLLVNQLKRLQLMQQQGIEIAEGISTVIKPPTVVIFAGHPLDKAGEEPCFPAELENQVKQEIHNQLDKLNADIGYCAAGAGSDILFIEAMLERNTEVHIALPCNHDDYIRERVAYAGSEWVQRCRNALQQATSVRYTTEEHYLGHDNLFRFNNVLIEGLARIQSELLLTDPHLLVVWDALGQQHAGGGSDFMNQWADIKTLHIIHLDEIREQLSATEQSSSTPVLVPDLPPTDKVEPERVVKAMLFLDIVGFSKLTEETLPQLWHFLERINEQSKINDDNASIDLVESWGDALYIAASSARSILKIAFDLKQGFEQQDFTDYGFSSALNIRVGLHSGPVFEGIHPFTGKPIVYGSHVSRAARIEPITVPGEIYASQQFIAMLSVEEKSIINESQMTREPYSSWYNCEYVGILPLAKSYGAQSIYHISGLH